MEIKLDAKLLELNVHPRYVEDAKINGAPEYTEEEIHNGKMPKMPFMVKVKGEWYWIVNINLDEGYIVAWPKGITAKVYYKVCDDGVYTLVYNDYERIRWENIYVPSILDISGKSFGDYIEFEIDENGYIKDFPKGKRLEEEILKLIAK